MKREKVLIKKERSLTLQVLKIPFGRDSSFQVFKINMACILQSSPPLIHHISNRAIKSKTIRVPLPQTFVVLRFQIQ